MNCRTRDSGLGDASKKHPEYGQLMLSVGNKEGMGIGEMRWMRGVKGKRDSFARRVEHEKQQ